MIDPVYSIVFTTALLGSGHCIGMCGPIVAALSLSRQGRSQGIFYHLFYNLGRLTTYVLIGLAAGWVGSLLNRTLTFSLLSQVLLILADLFVIGMGLRTTGLLKGLTFIHMESTGAAELLTRSVSSLQRLPGGLAAFPIGLLMGLLPCGFLYAIALAAAGSASALNGGMIMFFFGLGTLPALFLFGSTVHWLSGALRSELLRWAGGMVVFLGCYNLFRHIRLAGWL